MPASLPDQLYPLSVLSHVHPRQLVLAVRESANKSAASAAFLDSVKSQAMIKSADSAASLRGDRASGRLDRSLPSFPLTGACPASLGSYLSPTSQHLDLQQHQSLQHEYLLDLPPWTLFQVTVFAVLVTSKQQPLRWLRYADLLRSISIVDAFLQPIGVNKCGACKGSVCICRFGEAHQVGSR